MSHRNILAAFAIILALAVPLSAATTVTLTGGCPLYTINQNRSYITFNIANSGNGTASDFIISASFPGISAQNATVIIPQVGPDTNFTKQFYLSSLVGEGSYAVNINATYVQSGSNYATVFPCIVYIGSSAGGPLTESVSVTGKVMAVAITNIAPQSIEAQVDAVVPPVFSVKNATRPITIGPDGHTELYFNITAPAYSDASFPLIGELSYEYNGTHYAQMGSAPLVFGTGGLPTTNTGEGGNGIGLTVWVLAAMVTAILILIAISMLLRRRGGNEKRRPEANLPQPEKEHEHHHVDKEAGAHHQHLRQEKKPDEPK